MQRSAIRTRRDLVVSLFRLAERQLLGEIDDAVQLRIVLLQPREIQRRELAGFNLPAFHEPGEVGEREQRQLLVGAGHRASIRCRFDGRRSVGRLFPGGTGLKTIRLRVAQVHGSQPGESRGIAASAVQFVQNALLFIGGERHAGDLLGRLKDFDRDRRGVLRDRREGTGHQPDPRPAAEKHSMNRRRLIESWCSSIAAPLVGWAAGPSE